MGFSHLSLDSAFDHRPEEALAEYDRAIGLRPDIPALRYRKALILHRQGKYDQSLSELKEAARLDPPRTSAGTGPGVCGYCGVVFGTWGEAWSHEDHAHRYEQAVSDFYRPGSSAPGDCRR